MAPHTYNLKAGGHGGWDHLLSRIDLRQKGYQAAKAAMTDSEKNARIGHTFLKDQRGIFDQRFSHMRRKWSGMAFKGRSHSSETKHRIGSANAKHQLGAGNSMYGMMWIQHPELQINKIHKKTDPIPEGWIKGRKIKFN